MDMCVIFNPASARGRAGRKLSELRRRLGERAEFQATQGAGHAEVLARTAVASGFRTVVAAGGDGTVHEVANGVLQTGRDDVSFAVIPIGSANDYAYSLNRAWGSITQDNSSIRSVDVGMVRLADGRRRYFVNSLGLGFSGAVTIESRKVRWLSGLFLYGVGFLRALVCRFAIVSMEICLDEICRQQGVLSLTLAIGKREGNFVVAPDARLDDGWFDYLLVGAVSRWEVLRYMPRIAKGQQLPAEHPAIATGRCRETKVRSTEPLTIHLDGELLALPADGVQEFEARILPGCLRVLTVLSARDSAPSR
jgi:diacylglycerol kinase family enzyme